MNVPVSTEYGPQKVKLPLLLPLVGGVIAIAGLVAIVVNIQVGGLLVVVLLLALAGMRAFCSEEVMQGLVIRSQAFDIATHLVFALGLLFLLLTIPGLN